MKSRTVLMLAATVSIALFAAFFTVEPRYRDELTNDVFAGNYWQRMVMPGDLSGPHAFLDTNCAACHTPVKGVEAANCIVCHADDRVLQGMATAFHAEIGACAPCHLEHQGGGSRTTRMDHVLLARVGLQQLEREAGQAGQDAARLGRWLADSAATPESWPAHLQSEERLLDCAACHQTSQPHRDFFGMDCAQCHATGQWSIADFRHPSPSSKSCAQCHQAPPSHYMEHFKMVSMKTSGVEEAEVEQCFLCHQSTSWNDIQGVGFYKHH